MDGLISQFYSGDPLRAVPPHAPSDDGPEFASRVKSVLMNAYCEDEIPMWVTKFAFACYPQLGSA